MSAWKEYLGVVLVLGVIALLVRNGDKASKVITAAGGALNGTFRTIMSGGVGGVGGGL